MRPVERIIDASARNRVVVLLATAGLVVWGALSVRRAPLDALPDLSDTQVIVATEWMGRSPTLVEDQVTYPLVTSFLSAPRVKRVRGLTMFGMSFVTVVFEDGTDEYWARSRVVESLSRMAGRLPPGVAPQIGPDATGIGWVFEYALVARCRDRGAPCPSLQELRSFQDWTLRYQLASVPGVAEVASLGGFEKQYQVIVDPTRLQAYRLSLGDVVSAIKLSNGDVGGRVIEVAGHEYAVRGRGYVTDRRDLEQVVVTTDGRGTPVRLSEVGQVTVGGNIRRGLAELDGEGEVVGGIVVMRAGENALQVIERLRRRLDEVRGAFPPGVELVTTYDRSSLIREAVATLRDNLLAVMATVVLMVVVFLFHFRSSLVAAITLPVAVLLAFIPMSMMGLTINIMSLAGIIIAVGDMVDSAVVLVENAHKKLEREGATRPRTELVIEAARELGPAIFASLLILTIAFLPVFTLEAQEGRLFKPLAYTKSFSMAFAALLAITLVPALMVLFVRGRIRPELENPINRACIAVYRPLLRRLLRWRWAVVGATLALLAITVVPFSRLGSEFMPPLEEGSILFMPVTVPGISIEQARRLVQAQDQLLRRFPEVERVFGKAGRADTATDPAPLSMIETVVTLRPKARWREGMTYERLVAELERALAMPGVQNAFTMPIKARVDMLTTGIRTPLGVKVFGKDLAEIALVGVELERVLRGVPGTRSVYAERELGGFFIDFIPDRAALARHGLRVMDALAVVETAIGGQDIDLTIEGRERYRINVRYPRELRDDLEALRRVLVAVPVMAAGGAAGGMAAGGAAGGMAVGDATGPVGAAPALRQVPLGQLGRVEAALGPPMIKSEAGQLTGWVYVDVGARDLGGYVHAAKAAVARQVRLPTGTTLQWTGQYELLERVRARMRVVVPLTLLLIFAILYVNFRGVPQVLLVMASVPLAAVGSIWLMYALGFNTSIAVWVGLIALLGVATETASMMLVYLEEGFRSWREQGRLRSRDDLCAMVEEAATRRVRPLLMTVGMNIVGLVPVMFDTGIGADVAKRIAAPLWGGLLSLTALTLAVLPALYVLWRSLGLRPEPLGVAGRPASE